MTIHPNPIDKFKVLYDLPKDTWLVINIGGRGGGKSHESSKYITLKAICEGKRTIVMRDEKSKIDESILNEVKKRFGEIDEASNGYIRQVFDMQEGILKKRIIKKTNDPNEGSLIFTMGFRASSTGKVAHLKSISDIDIALIEEIEDLTDEDKFNTLADSVRNKDSFVMINSNVPSKDHWFIKRYFTLEDTDHEGYFKIIPKNVEGVVYILTNYTDNKHLQPKTIRKYKAYGDEKSELYDKHYYLTQILGYSSSGLKGAIYKGWKRISWEEYHNLDYNKYYYIDWGTNDACAIGEVKIHNRIMLVKPLHYMPADELTIGKFLSEKGFSEKDIIVCDSSQPNSIMMLRNGWGVEDLGLFDAEKYPQLLKGFSTIGVRKGSGSILEGINIMRTYDVHIVDGSDGDNAWNEYLEYRWAIDKDGNPTDQPIDKNNHHMDGIRYVAYMLPQLC